MSKFEIIVLNEGDNIQLTVPGEYGKTCIYITNSNGKIIITGGSGIIERIEGKGMEEKFVKNK